MLVNWLTCVISVITSFGFMEYTCGIQYGREYWYEEAHITLQRRLSSSAESRTRYARNVVLFVGDGLGIATMTAARIFKGQRQGQTGEESNLEWDKFSALALAKTYNLDSQVGESSACATALLCGVKAYQETVGLDVGGRFDNCFSSFTSKVESLIDWAQKAGKSTGIVTNTRVTHATPAALYAHSASRYWEDDSKVPSAARKACKDIARQLVEESPGKNIDVILGGGRRHWLPKMSRDPEVNSEEGRRLDGRNLIDDWIRDRRKTGVRAEYVWNKEQMDTIDPMKVDSLLGLFAYSHMDFEADRDTGPNGDPSLADMTKKALSIVQKNSKGFFLFVESGRIDHAHHYNNAYRALDETLVLESALLTVLSLVDLTETLIVVTSDHSNVMTFGGLTTPRGNPILGPDTKVSDIDGFAYSTLLYGNGPGYSNPRAVPRNFTSVAEERNLVHGSAAPRQWATHGGEDVPVYAQGPLASIVFRGVVEQSYIPHAIAYIVCIGQYAKRCNNNYTTTRPVQTCIVPEVSSIKTSSKRGRGGVVLASSVLSGSVRTTRSPAVYLMLIIMLLSHYFFIT